MIGNHQNCIVDEVRKLMDRGFTCYVEEDLWIEPPEKGKRINGRWMKKRQGRKVVVDIYATNGKKELLIEIGTLSNIHGDRLSLLKSLKPNAQIVHVHQWKNYGLSEIRLYDEWCSMKMQHYLESEQARRDMTKMGESLAHKR